jgi:hypothetical protein
MKRALALVALSLTACQAPVLEALQAVTRCQYRFSGTPSRYDTLELGRQTSAGFVPFVDGEDVEMAPWSVEDSVGRWYFQDVFVRLSPLVDVGATVCAQVSGDLGAGISNDQGVLLSRASDGGYVGGPVPFFTGIDVNAQERFPELLDASVPFVGELLVGNGSDLVGGSLTAISLRRVNHVGFLGVPRPPPPPDAGLLGGGVLELGLSFITVRPGEDVRVLISLSGDRLGESVTLVADPLPAGVTLTFPSTLAPNVNALTARLSVAANVGPMSIPLRLTAQGALTRGVRESFINVIPAVEREVALTVFGPDAAAPVGSTVSAEVHLAPLAGFSGPVTLVAEAPPELDVVLPTTPVSLTAPMNVTVQVRAKTPNPGTVRFYAVAKRDVWGGTDLPFATSDAVSSQVVLLPGFSERRVLTPGQPLSWQVQTYGLPGGATSQLTVTGAPAGCALTVPGSGVNRVMNVTCDAGLPATVAPLGAVATAGGAMESATWTLVVPGAVTGLESFGVAPEPRPQSLDQEWPQVAGTLNDRFVLGTESNDLGPSVVGFDGGYGVPAPVIGDGVRVVTVGQAASTRALQVTRLQGTFFSIGTPPGGPTNARGPFDADGHPDGTLWGATGTPTRVWLGHLSASTWVDDSAALPDLPGVTDLALAVHNQQTVLVTAEPQVVVRRLQAGTWTTLPAFPAQLVGVPHTVRTSGRRVLDVVIDNTAQPVVGLITRADQLEVYRLESGVWVKLQGLTPTPGLIPLSLSMAVNFLSMDPTARLTLVWHEATQASALRSGTRVLPRVAQSKLRLARHTTTGFVELPSPGLDAFTGAPEHPHVAFDRDGRPYVSFVENGRVFVQRAAP